ncbi:MFS transporter [Duganella fentianensis]|uniref:MFS transporter n=1 Tax=Duganella fentianensis TaxID=2692177 RepID=UPI003530A822
MLSALRLKVQQYLERDALLRNGNFVRYWISAILNDFGSYISALALPLCSALLLHATPAQMGILGAASAIPFALLALPTGVLLDRHRKLPVLLASKLVQALTLGSVPLIYWLGHLSIEWMYGVALISGCCSLVGGGAEQIFLTSLIGRDRLIEAQSKFAAVDSVARVVAPGIAGVLIQWLTAPFAVIVNALGFICSILILRNLKANDPKPEPSKQHMLRDIHDGLLFIWRTPLLRTLAWGAGIWHMLFYGFAALSVLFGTRELGMTAGLMGMAQMVGGIGVLLSSILVKPLNARYGPTGAMLTGIGLTACAFAAMPAIPANLFGSPTASAVANGLVSMVLDCGVMLFFMPYMTLRQKVTPDAYLGRMVSTMRFLTVASAPAGALLAGYLGEHLSIRAGLACVAAGGIALTLAMVFAPALRNVPEHLAPAQP